MILLAMECMCMRFGGDLRSRMNSMNQKRFATIGFLILIIVIAGALGYFAFVYTPSHETPEESVLTPEPTSTPELTPTPAPVPKLTPAQNQWNIMTWGGDTKEWSRKLNLTGIRWACDNQPEDCVSTGNDEARRENVEKYFISMGFAKVPPSTLKDYARQYSELSLRNPMLQEIGTDDFVVKALYYWYEELHMTPSQVEVLLNEAIDNTKSANPNLKFGVVLYEKELRDLELLDDAHLPPSIRKRIDYVHLFIIYRSNGPGYANDVQTAKRLFPNAKIIAGSYPYDQIDYVPCNRGDHEEYWWERNPQARCTPEQERDYYRTSIEIQARLLKQGVVDWIELFPGFMGNEKDIPFDYYNNPPWSGGCLRPRSECINNTKTLEQIALDVLNS